jgi:hypothetical protein
MLADGDPPEEKTDGRTRRRAMLTTVTVAVVCIIVVTAVMVNRLHLPPSEDGEEEEREYYSGEPGDYYGPGIGPVYITGCTAGLVNVDLASLDLAKYDELPIYTLSPPRLETKQDAAVFLAGFAYDVSNYSYYYNDVNVKGHVFLRGATSISVELGGAISVHVSSPSPPLWQPNITAEEAIAIATGYLENHTGYPDGAIMDVGHDNISNLAGDRCITAFYIHFLRRSDGFDFATSGSHANHIIIEVDAYHGSVVWFVYAWADLVRTGTIGGGELDDLDTIADRYISWHNDYWGERLAGDAPVLNITGVTIEYRPPFGTSAGDMYEGSPRYVYLPHIRIDIGGGFAYMSPLSSYEED